MAKLSNFRVNSHAVETGQWVSPGDEYDDLLIQARGWTDAYRDAMAAKQRRAAMRYGGDVSRLPAAVTREISIECLIQHALLDVKNIVDDDGKEVSFEQFCDMIRSPDYNDLWLAAIKAVSLVGTQQAEELEHTKKNSPKR